MSLIGTHHRKYKGQAFYREKRDVRKFYLSGRVMVDAASFRDENPNYFFPRVDEKLSKDDSSFWTMMTPFLKIVPPEMIGR